MALAFDTLKYAKTLEEAGVSPKIAEAHATAQAESLGAIIKDNLATKADINLINQDIALINQDIISIHHDMTLINQNIQILRKDTNTNIERLRQETKMDIALIRKDIEELTLKMTIKLGGLIVVAVGALAMITKL